MNKRIFCGVVFTVSLLLTSCGEKDELAYQREEASETVSEETTENDIGQADQELSTETQDKESREEEARDNEDEKESVERDSDTQKDEPTALVEEPVADIVTITISAVGDVSLGNYAEQGYDYSFNQTYEKQDSAYFLANVRDIFEADDFTIVNLEGPLTDLEEIRIEKEFEIKGKPEYVKILTDGKVEAVTLANNHILDYTEQGRQDTVKLLEEEGILYAYNQNLAFFEVKGIRIGIVAVSDLAQSESNARIIKNGIDSLKEQGAQIILACCHWGEEYQYIPNEYQINLGRQCIDWGADLVLGCHPHILESIEEYNGGYIAYSMGNFCFGANRNPKDKDSMIFQPTFTFVDGVKQDEIELRIIPCSISSVSARNNFQPTPASGEEAVRIIDKINEISKDFGIRFDYDGNKIKDEK